MKKEYMKPQMEAIEINHRQQLLTGSAKNVSGNVFNGDITGSSEPGRAPEFQEMENLLFGM